MHTANRYLSTLVGCAVLWLSVDAQAQLPANQAANRSDAGGQFTGLAQAPEANLFVGAATTSIPIDLPPGRKNMTPKLALSYSSSGGPSPYGVGWDLPLGKIQRCGKQGVLQCGGPYWNDFVLVLPGVNAECHLEGNVCIPKVEEAWIRIEYVTTGNKWLVWDKSGMKYTFGDVSSARTGTSGAVQCSYTYSWALTRIDDPTGNYAEIQYSNVQQILYPELITYGGNSNTPVVLPMFAVAFSWSTRAPDDQIVNGIAGFPSKLTRRLSTIDVRYTGAANPLVRRYGFLYFSHPTDGRQNLLDSVTMYGSDGTALSRVDNSPASTTFVYQRNVDTTARIGFLADETVAQPAAATSGSRVDTDTTTDTDTTKRALMDINGDGFVDLVNADACTSAASGGYLWEVYLGSAAGLSTTASSWKASTCWLDHSVQVGSNLPASRFTSLVTMDVTGDGIPDQIGDLEVLGGYTLAHNPTQILPAQGTPFWQDSEFGSWYLVRRGAVGDPQCGSGVVGCFLNEDNDGDPTTNQWWYIPEGARYWGVRNSERLPANGHPAPLVLGNRTYQSTFLGGTVDYVDLVDMNGDGLPDIVHSGPTFWNVWFNTGHGFAATATQFPAVISSLRYTDKNGLQHWGLYDVNGDGLVDQVTDVSRASGNTGTSEWEFHLNDGRQLTYSTSMSAPGWCGVVGGIRHSVVSATEPDVIRDFFDVNGDGLPDRVTACTNGWQVQLNHGASLAVSTYTWVNGPRQIRAVDMTGNWRTETTGETIDFDGDGMVDYVDFSQGKVRRNLGGAWLSATQQNPDGGKPDLLIQVENGLGASTFLNYRPSTDWNNDDDYGVPRLPFVLWTVSQIDQDDGLCEPPGAGCVYGGEHTSTTEITYDGGFYDAPSRELRGFEKVTQTDSLSNAKVTWFYQDMGRKGKTNVEAFYDSVGVVQETLNEWWCVNSNSPSVYCDDIVPGETLKLRLRDQTTWEMTDSHQLGTQSSVSFLDYDACGNVTKTTKTGTVTPAVTTEAVFTCPGPSPSPPYILDRPTYVATSDALQVAPRERKWFEYLANGNVSMKIFEGRSDYSDHSSANGPNSRYVPKSPQHRHDSVGGVRLRPRRAAHRQGS